MSAMTDAELFTPPPNLIKAPVEGDPAIWTVLGEAGGHAEGQRAVASTIANRARHIGSSADAVVNDPGQGYEAWTPAKRAKLQKDFPVGSPAYQAAQANVGGILSGDEPAPYEYDSFYSPQAQKNLGRQPPKWDDGSGVNLGGNLFFTGKYQAPAALSEADQAAWEKLQGGRDISIAPTNATPNPGAPATAQADAVKFLKLHGFFDEDAVPGSSQRPLIETETSGIPTKPGTYYLPRSGGLRVVGDDAPDLLPAYRDQVGIQSAAMEKPLLGRMAFAGGPQGVQDVAASVNKLLGGGLAADPLTGIGGGPTAYDLAQASMRGFDQARDRYNLEHGPDPAAKIGRLLGNLAVVAPTLSVGEGALGALGLSAREAAPGIAPVLDFLSGNAGAGNLLLRAPSKAVHGAQQGAAVSLLNSSQSDRPLGEQMRHGAGLGALMTGAVPVMGAAKNLLLDTGGGAKIAPEVSGLASLATQKYGIPLRATQIKGVGDRNMAVKDSEMISRPGTGFADNNAAQRQAFTKAVAGTFGSDADKLTPQVMQAAKHRIGGEFERVAQNTHITDTNQLQSNLQKVVDEAGQVLPDSDVVPLAKQVQNITSAIKDGVLSGESYQALTRKGSPLDRATESSNSNIRSYAQDLRHVLDDALEAHATPQDAAALAQARWQYKNLMTVKNLAAKAGVSGEISPALLNGAVNTSFKNRAFSGAGDLGELAQIGQTFMKEPPNSGTPARLKDMIKGAALGGGGVADLMLAMHDPVLAAKLAGGAAGLGALRYTGNMISGAVNRSPAVVNRLITRSSQPEVPASLNDIYSTLGQIAGPTYVPAGVLADRNRLLALPAPLTVP